MLFLNRKGHLPHFPYHFIRVQLGFKDVITRHVETRDTDAQKTIGPRVAKTGYGRPKNVSAGVRCVFKDIV